MKVQLSGYQHEWPDLFEIEKSVLLDWIDPCVHRPIEHVGSTAVPGLKAKPIICSSSDEEIYPNDDLSANFSNTGKWVFSRKDGTKICC